MSREGVAVGAIILSAMACFVLIVGEHAVLGGLCLIPTAWGIYTLIKAPKKAKKFYRSESSYMVEEQSDGQLRFDILTANQRSNAPFAAVFVGLMVTCIMGFITAFMVALHGSPLLLILSPGAGVGIALAILQSRKDYREHVFDTRIYVSDHAINYPDPQKDRPIQMIQVDTVERLRIQQSVANTQITRTGGPNSAIGEMGLRAKAKWMNWMADHSYTLEAHAAGRRYVLAGGMNEVTARSLMQAISRKLDI